VGITITALGAADSVVSVWRVVGGDRNPVRGARRAVMNDSAYVIDYDAPLGRPIRYEVEIISGPSGVGRFSSAPVTVESDSAWIMDPLIPQSAVPIRRRMSAPGEPVFQVEAMSSFEYQAKISMFDVMGSDRPMALVGQRAAANGINLSLMTDMAEQNTRLRNLFRQAAQLLVRVPPSVTDAIEGSCFVAVATVVENSQKAHTGRDLTKWTVQGDTVAAPAIKVLTALFTYGDINILYSTYQQKQTIMAGKTYLDDLKNPLGG
jgi:hypothetical protein